MKAKALFVFSISALFPLLLGRGAFAQSVDDLSGLSLSAVGQSLDYRETVSGSTVDKDSGMMWGISAKWRKDFNPFFLLCNASYTSTQSATYDGALQYYDGSTEPYWFDSEKESIVILQADLGYKLFKFEHFAISPCLGFGYRDWTRGEDDSSTGDYAEDYHWFFVDCGLNFDYATGNWSIGLLGKIGFPPSPKMDTDYNTNSISTYSLGAVPFYIVSATVQCDFPSSNPYRSFFLSISPFFEHWGVGKSDIVDSFYEPDSTTNIYGATIGFGMKLGNGY